MLAILDCDILSTFAKINEIKLLEELFSKLQIPNAVYVELMEAKTLGFEFPDNVFKSNIELTALKPDEFRDFEQFIRNRGIHHGEAEGMSIARNRNAAFLTNDRKVVRSCEESNILVLDLKDILTQIARDKLIDKEKMLQMLKDIEAKDNTILKEKDEILEEYRGMDDDVTI